MLPLAIRIGLALAALGIAPACTKPVSAAEACERLRAAEEVSECQPVEENTISFHASAMVQAELVSAPRRYCTVLQFASSRSYDDACVQFEEMADAVGPHRFGNAAARIFVHCNEALTGEHGLAVKRVVDRL